MGYFPMPAHTLEGWTRVHELINSRSVVLSWGLIRVLEDQQSLVTDSRVLQWPHFQKGRAWSCFTSTRLRQCQYVTQQSL
uniref:Uncharacterized protein n=1 Tax=Triticum urartu TaxID=4572 RepID=A0A8R7Q4G7_TRIUA